MFSSGETSLREIRMLIGLQSRCFNRINEIQSALKHLRISTWSLYIWIHNLLSLEKEKKRANWVFDFLILLMKRIRLHIYSDKSFFKAEKWLISQEYHYWDENWIFYDNVQCKGQWIDKNKSLQPTPKADTHGVNVVLCVWGDHCSIIHSEF